MPYIDWLSVQQTHRGKRLPRIGGSLVVYIDPETGEPQREVLYGFQHEGSFDSRLQIRCDGEKVEVSGNPSRFGQPDNVFGLTSVEAGIELYNRVLDAHGLPPFSVDERSSRLAYFRQRPDRLMRVGARLTRVDVCENYALGGPAGVDAVLRAVGSFVHQGRRPTIYPGAVMWGKGSRYLGLKYYDKSQELRHHGRTPYRDRLADWCKAEGVLRHEVSLRLMALSKSGLDSPDRWGWTEMCATLERYAKHRQVGVGVGGLLGIRERLMELGHKGSIAGRAQQIALAYAAGERVRETLTHNTYYRYRRVLLELGVDIGGELNVTALPLQVREVRMQVATPPEWYRAA